MFEAVCARAVALVRSIYCLSLQQQRHDDLEAVLLRGENERSNLFGELVVVVELVLVEERFAMKLEVGADLLVLWMFDDDLSDLFIAKVYGR